MVFTYKIFNVEVLLEDLSNTGATGEYRLDTRIIAIDYAYVMEIYTDLEKLKAELRRIVVHELTHFFDFNCWKSWSYKDEVAYEHLATFNEIYHEPIQALTELIVEWCLTQEVEEKPKKPKTKFVAKKKSKQKKK
jgi:hypothetical protein